jgi:hypothetical protein
MEGIRFFYPGICLTTEEKAWKNLSKGKKNLSQVKKTSVRVKNLSHIQRSQKTSMPPVGFEPHNPSNRAAADLRLRPCGHWDWSIRNNCWKLRDIVLATKRDPRFHKQKLCNLSQGFKRSQYSRVHNYFLERRYVRVIQGHFRIS